MTKEQLLEIISEYAATYHMCKTTTLFNYNDELDRLRTIMELEISNLYSKLGHTAISEDKH
jgi:hypothetical protein